MGNAPGVDRGGANQREHLSIFSGAVNRGPDKQMR